jgi:hypothetical protein
MLEQQLERLTSGGFQLLPVLEITTHYVLERDGFVALAERRADGSFGNFGAAGKLLEGAFAVLVWREEGPVFVAKGKQWPATPEQVETLRRFEGDLRNALE